MTGGEGVTEINLVFRATADCNLAAEYLDVCPQSGDAQFRALVSFTGLGSGHILKEIFIEFQILVQF